jgi:hypothetical protein
LECWKEIEIQTTTPGGLFEIPFLHYSITPLLQYSNRGEAPKLDPSLGILSPRELAARCANVGPSAPADGCGDMGVLKGSLKGDDRLVR